MVRRAESGVQAYQRSAPEVVGEPIRQYESSCPIRGNAGGVDGRQIYPRGPYSKHRRERGKEIEESKEGAQGLEDVDAGIGDGTQSKDTAKEDPTDKNTVAWQAKGQRSRGRPMRRLMRRDVLYLMIVNMPLRGSWAWFGQSWRRRDDSDTRSWTEVCFATVSVGRAGHFDMMS